MAATAAQSLSNRTLLHPRGFCISAAFTCPVCGKLLLAYRLNHKNGVWKCSSCGTLFKAGINLFIIPQGPGQSYHMAPDETIPGVERSMDAIRRRTRERRVSTLRELGLDDPVPQIALERYSGQEINSVTVVEPRTPDPGV